MDETKHLDFTKLLGFQTVATEGTDLDDETVADKLGARIGGLETLSPAKEN
jgi:hypothetical protein